jgi:hypothetical protein
MNSFLDPLGFVLARYYDLAGLGWGSEAKAYVQAHGLDLESIAAHAGVLAIVPCRFVGNGRFELDEEGEAGVVVEVLGDDAATTIDLCAWPVDRPDKSATTIGAADALGIANVDNPASWACGRRAMPVWKTPLAWLRSGCAGVVILDHRLVSYWLARALGPIAVEDVEHGRQIRAMLSPPRLKHRIMVRETPLRPAA